MPINNPTDILTQGASILRVIANNLPKLPSFPFSLPDLLGYTAGSTTGTITGLVTDSSNNPLAGVSVSATGVAATTTDSNGNFNLSNVPTGTCTVIFEDSGYTSVAETLNIMAGTNTLNVQMATAPAGGGRTEITISWN